MLVPDAEFLDLHDDPRDERGGNLSRPCRSDSIALGAARSLVYLCRSGALTSAVSILRCSLSYHVVYQKMPKPTFFLPPHFHNPPDGPLKLGQLITAVDDPGNALDTPEPFLSRNINVYTNELTVESHDYTAESSAELSLFAKAIQAIGVKAGVNWGAQQRESILSHIERLEVSFIQPDDNYVKASLLRPKVYEKLKFWFWHKRAFMITGLRVAYPSTDAPDKISLDTGSEDSRSLEFEGSGPAGSGTAGGGGKAATRSSSSYSLKLIPRQPFVYAFQLRACRYGRRRVTNKVHTDGAVMSEVDRGSDGQREDTPDEDDPEAWEFVFDEVADEDLSLDELGLDGEGLTLVEGNNDVLGQACDIIVPV